ncbi:MAG: hypothetical protein OXT67_10235 [Zetaproteobacteria bacterium]|nr:hypothetical protein [Zetaproteobacteria bacterium]
MKYRLAFILLSVCWSVASCGRLEPALGRKHIGQEMDIVRVGEPHVFAAAEPECDRGGAVSDLGVMQVWIYNRGNLVLESFDFSGFSGHGLQSEVIAQAVVGMRTAVQGRTMEPGKKLYFCRQNSFYAKDSLENAALAAAAGIYQAFKMARRVLPQDLPPPLQLVVQPLFIEQQVEHLPQGSYRERTYIETNNAFWTTGQSSLVGALGPAIFVIPPERRAVVQQQMMFWENLGVFAHEYGHHLFWMLAPQAALRGDETRREDSYWARAGMNEAFADLIAFYSFAENADTRGEMTLLGNYNRDILSSRCADKSATLKILDQAFVEVYFSDLSYPEPEPGGLHPKDSHALGSILAHGFHRLLRQSHGLMEVPSSLVSLPERRAWLLTQWVRQVEAIERKFPLNDGKYYLNQAIHLFVQLVARHQSGKRLNHLQHHTLQAFFPEYRPL